VITIDGNSGCGKSSTAKTVASKLNYLYLDTGSMYRAVTLYFLNSGVNLNNENEIHRALEQVSIEFDRNDGLVMLNGKKVEAEIRGSKVSNHVSQVSAIPEVREKMVEIQRKIGSGKGVVMDGRDIGSIVLPDADLKFFMTADLEVRSRRRLKELQEKNIGASYEEVYQNLKNRDYQDTTRKVSPLIKPEDAITIDTSNITFQQQVNTIINLVYQKIK